MNDTLNVHLDDIVAAFKNNVCVGWINIDPNGYTSVPVMGAEDDSYPNYMEEGDIPNFKFYDYSQNEFFNLDPPLNIEFPGWSLNQFYIIEGILKAQ